jgi:hypothetical protein
MSNYSSQWILQFVLPNLVLREPIECEFVALVPNQDSRLDSSRTGASGQILSCFENPFGKKLQPAALLTRRLSGNQKPSLEAILAFRNAVAMAVLVTQWSIAHHSLGTLASFIPIHLISILSLLRMRTPVSVSHPLPLGEWLFQTRFVDNVQPCFLTLFIIHSATPPMEPTLRSGAERMENHCSFPVIICRFPSRAYPFGYFPFFV